MKNDRFIKLTILLISILLIGGLVGCSKQECPECENNTITINKTITIFNETIKYVNKTLECPEYNKSREIELIRRLKFLENQQDKYFNDTECNWELNRTEDELKDCREELCDEWNSSWC